MLEYIIEAAIGKRFKCPYCESRLEREKLISHIEKEHDDMIPQGYTATRVVFNLINKKDHGNCVTCGRITPWNEDLARYERFCIDNNGKCKEEAGKIAKYNMIKTYGKETLLDDPEWQKKMLANRSISGTYKFSTGGTVSYTGSYEMKLLEFLDKVMGYRSIDISSPGPSIEYEYNGQKHIWITDQYLFPYNLVFDVKDGGDNPNNRQMDDYRAKQEAKEAAIAKLGKYNYIRLTDNNFSQLMLVLAELKMQLIDNQSEAKPIIRINENNIININEDCSNLIGDHNSYKSIDEYSSAVIGAMVDGRSSVYVVPYMMKNSFNVDYGVTDSESLCTLLHSDEKGDIKVLGGKSIKENCEVFGLFKFINPNEPKFNRNDAPSNLAEVITGKKILDPNQLLYDSDFEQVIPFDKMLDFAQDSFIASLKGTQYEIPVVGESCIDPDSNISYWQDQNGFFAKNNISKLRSKSYNEIAAIPKELCSFISKGSL